MGACAGSLPAAVSAPLQGTGPWVRLHDEEGRRCSSRPTGNTDMRVCHRGGGRGGAGHGCLALSSYVWRVDVYIFHLVRQGEDTACQVGTEVCHVAVVHMGSESMVRWWDKS